MTTYLQQLRDDQSTLQNMLEILRSDRYDAGDLDSMVQIEGEILTPGLRAVHEACIASLEDTISIFGMLINYAEANRKAQ